MGHVFHLAWYMNELGIGDSSCTSVHKIKASYPHAIDIHFLSYFKETITFYRTAAEIVSCVQYVQQTQANCGDWKTFIPYAYDALEDLVQSACSGRGFDGKYAAHHASWRANSDNCWTTSLFVRWVSLLVDQYIPRAHVAKFYNRPRLIHSVQRT